MKKIITSKLAFSLLLYLSLALGAAMLTLKYYYWDLMDPYLEFPEFSYWLYLIVPFFIVSVLSLIHISLRYAELEAYLPLSVCVITALVTLYAPYTVLYKESYDALYEDGHESRHDEKMMLELLKNGKYEILEEYLLKVHKLVNDEHKRSVRDTLLNGSFGGGSRPVVKMRVWLNSANAVENSR